MIKTYKTMRTETSMNLWSALFFAGNAQVDIRYRLIIDCLHYKEATIRCLL